MAASLGVPFPGWALAGWNASGNSSWSSGPGFPGLNIELVAGAIAATLRRWEHALKLLL